MAFRHILQIYGVRSELSASIKDRQIAIEENHLDTNNTEYSLAFRTAGAVANSGSYLTAITYGNSARLKSLTIGQSENSILYKLPTESGTSGQILTMKDGGNTAWESPIQSLWNMDQNRNVYLTEGFRVSIGGADPQGTLTVHGSQHIENSNGAPLLELRNSTDQKKWTISDSDSILYVHHEDSIDPVLKLSVTAGLEAQKIKSTEMSVTNANVNNLNASTLSVTSSASVKSLTIGSGNEAQKLNINDGGAYISNVNDGNLIEFCNAAKKSWFLKFDNQGVLSLVSSDAPSSSLVFKGDTIISNATIESNSPIISKNGITLNNQPLTANAGINCKSDYNGIGNVNCSNVNSRNVYVSGTGSDINNFGGAVVFENKTSEPIIPTGIRNALYCVNGELYWVRNDGTSVKVISADNE